MAERLVYTEAEVVDMVIGVIADAGSLRKAAMWAFGVSPQFLSKVVLGEKRPGPAIYMSLGLDRHKHTEFPEMPRWR